VIISFKMIQKTIKSSLRNKKQSVSLTGFAVNMENISKVSKCFETPFNGISFSDFRQGMDKNY
jgi:hypothetical protein